MAAGRLAVRTAAVISIAIAGSASAQVPSVEQEVRDNVLSQPIGEHTVRDLDLPEEFVRRVADRIIRSSYREQAHLVAEDRTPESSPPASTAGRPWWLLGAAGVCLIVALIALGGLWRRKEP